MNCKSICTIAILSVLISSGCGDKETSKDIPKRKQPEERVMPAAGPAVKPAGLNTLMQEIKSFTTSDFDSIEQVSEELDTCIGLLESQGILVSVLPERNRALVDLNQWKDLSRQKKSDIMRCLAFYCGLKRGVALFWAEVYDDDSDVILGKYVHNRQTKIYV